ncbi:hypothetical protein KC19_1G210000 [Ceratodon purpureus]|uniref:SOUL heme-binding protein n=1 Tax=Ceratodon purpureus TaxID=3225 RepID=A0A8T0J7M6_CERPU|nr:hypothetical protein KC19_1G210000 [Ceratodon purpureus]
MSAMAAHSLSRTLGSCSGVIALKSDVKGGESAGALRLPFKGLKAAGSVERVARGEFGRVLRTRERGRGSGVVCGAGVPTLEKERKGLPEGYMEQMQEFLRKDLVHLFDEQGIDKTMYDEKVEFRDPITNYDTLDGYLFNIGMLRALFQPIFELHSVKQTAPYELTTRWTMTMNFWIVLWKPQLIFTGVSIMRVNPETGKFCAHIDLWDSIQNNDYFSVEGAKDVIRQMQYFKQPDLETPKYRVLKRRADYQVREYEPFIVAETDCDGMAGSKGFNTVAGYIFGKNEKGQKIKMTTPVYTETSSEPSSSGAKIQIVLPASFKLSELPAPEAENVNIQQVDKRIAAAIRFNGKPTPEVVEEKRKILEQALKKDGLKMKGTFGLARYNDPGRTWPVFMKNEVLAWLEDFQLD